MEDEKLTGTNDDKYILGMVLANKSEAENYLNSSGLISDWQAYYDLSRSIPDKKPYNWMSNKFIPMTMSKIETAVSYMLGMLFSTNPNFRVMYNDMADKDQAKVIERLLAYQIEQCDLYFKFLNFIKQVCTYGTGIGKIYWDTREENKKIRQKNYQPILNIFGLPIGQRYAGTTIENIKQVIFDGPQFEVCNLGDVFVDPSANDIQDSWVVHRTYKTRAHLVSLMKDANGNGIYNENVLKIAAGDTVDGNKEGKEEIESSGQRTSIPSVTQSVGSGLIEVLEWYGKYPLYDDNLVSCLFTVAAGKYVIRADENPFWHGKNPFIRSVYISLPNEFYGIGIPEMLYDLQTNLNEIVNQRNDNISFALNRPAQYKKGSGVNTKGLIFKPGGIYGADENDAIKWEVIPDVTSSAFAHTGEIERWSQEVTAITKLTLGMGGKDQAQTFGGQQLMQRASGERLSLHAKIIENLAFKELLTMFYELDYQFLDQEKVIRVVGEDGIKFVPVKPEDLEKHYDFAPAGVFNMEDKGNKSLRLIQFLNIAKDYPRLKIQKVLEKLYMLMDIGENPKEILMTDEELAKQQLQQMVQGQMPGQPMAGGQPQQGGQGIGQQGNFVGGESAGIPQAPSMGSAQLPPQMQTGQENIGMNR